MAQLDPHTPAGIVAAAIRTAIECNASCRIIAAVTAAAVRSVQPFESDELASRMHAIKPAIRAQLQASQSTGVSHHTSKDVAPPDVHVGANVAKPNFATGTLFGEMSMKQVRAAQRGRSKRHREDD